MALDNLIYVASVPYSGSTLLNILLGQQPRCLALGEVHQLGMPAVERIHGFGNRCSCGRRVHECDYWEDLRLRLAKASGLPSTSDWSEWKLTTQSSYLDTAGSRAWRFLLGFNCWLPSALRLPWSSVAFSELRSSARHSWTFFERLAEITSASHLVDSTKAPSRLVALRHTDSKKRLRVIYLVRDGRSVAHSLLKRGFGDFRQSVRIWKRSQRSIQLAIREVPRNQIFEMSYEELCNETEKSLASLSEFLGLPIDTRLAALPESAPHMIPGNPMTFRGDRDIRLREDWKEGLSSNDLNSFQRLAGRMNARIGYRT